MLLTSAHFLSLKELVAQLHQIERQIQACENSLREEKEKRRKYYVSFMPSLDPKGQF